MIIKKYIINKVNVLIMCFILICLFCFIPVNNNEFIVSDENKLESNIYFLDKDNYVSRVSYFFDESTIEKLVSEKINLLINGFDENFISLIPKDTKVNKISVEKDNLYIDFSKEFYNVNEYYEDEMIESIIYSMCDINGINYIYLSVDGIAYTEMFNSKKKIDYPLSKDFGINKEYNITDLKNINKTVVVFAKENNNIIYYVPITKIYNSIDDKIEVIIDELKSSVNSQDGLVGYLDDSVNLVNSVIDNDSITLVFSGIKSNEYEEFINLSIRENYKIDNIFYKYE